MIKLLPINILFTQSLYNGFTFKHKFNTLSFIRFLIVSYHSCTTILQQPQNMKLNQETASTSIYLEQIQNHIDLSQGYNKIRHLLFKQLYRADESDPGVDDKLADTVAIKLADGLKSYVAFHQSQKVFRALQIVTDLLTYVEPVMTPAMHSQLFVNALASVAMPKIVTFNMRLDNINREVALGIFAFWFQKYIRPELDPYELFLMGYRKLKDEKMIFPPVNIKPVDYRQKMGKNEKITQQIANSNKIVLEDIDEFTLKTQKAFKDEINSIVTTQYVRLIKHKSKILYEFTQKGSTLTQKEKNMVKDLYKRLRVMLKEIDKVNQIKISKKVSSNEKEYIENKITPKKTQHKIDSPAKVEKDSAKKQQQEKNKAKEVVTDLLDMDTSAPAKDVNVESKKESPKKETPKKETPKKQEIKIDTGLDLLDLNSNVPTQQYNYQSPPKQTPVNFGDLLGDSSVISPQKSPQKQEQDDQQFVQAQLVSEPQNNAPQSPVKQKISVNQDIFSSPKTPEPRSTPKKMSSHHSEDSNHLVGSQHSSKSKGQLQFNNEQYKDKYGFIPHDLDLSPQSSRSGQEKQENIREGERGLKDKIEGFKGKLFGLFGGNQPSIPESQDLYDDAKPYDDYPQMTKSQPIENHPHPPQKFILEEPSGPLPVYKPVKAIDYSKFTIQTSPKSQEDEDVYIHKNKQFDNLEEAALPESPTKKEKEQGNLLEQDD